MRKPDTPCADCGTLLFSGRGSLPAGQRKCRSCRSQPDHVAALRERRLAGWRAKGQRQRACACGAALAAARVRRCDQCKRERRNARDAWRGAKKRGAQRPDGPRISVHQLAERDGWRCHLCRRKVNRALSWPHPRSASIDHLVPVADGGTHDPTNLRLAHLGCNSARGTGGMVQLLLVG
jgi:hypothetical protein